MNKKSLKRMIKNLEERVENLESSSNVVYDGNPIGFVFGNTYLQDECGFDDYQTYNYEIEGKKKGEDK